MYVGSEMLMGFGILILCFMISTLIFGALIAITLSNILRILTKFLKLYTLIHSRNPTEETVCE